MKKLILLFALLIPQLLYSQWYQQQIPVNKPITGIKFIDTLRGWACTSYGTQQDSAYIIHTTNGGTNWFVQVRARATFTALSVIDSLYVNASAYDLNTTLVKLYKTSNGGQTWDTIGMVPNMWIDDMQFLNKDSAWECGLAPGPDVRTTTDGGVTWVVRTNGFTAPTQKIFFFNYYTGYCGAWSYLFKTTNAGFNWSFLYSFGGEDVHGIYFKNLDTGWVGLAGGQIGSTTNGGINWLVQQPNPLISDNTYDIYFINNIGWAGTAWYRRIFKTTNSGQNWGYQSDTSGSFKISIVDTLHGWSGYFGNGFISYTTNGGGPIFYTGFVPNGNKVPANFRLLQNYPNPFNPYTTIKIDISRNSTISLIIYDILGRQRYLVKDQYLKAGTYEFNWDSRNESSGIYFYTLISDNYRESKKMVLLK